MPPASLTRSKEGLPTMSTLKVSSAFRRHGQLLEPRRGADVGEAESVVGAGDPQANLAGSPANVAQPVAAGTVGLGRWAVWNSILVGSTLHSAHHGNPLPVASDGGTPVAVELGTTDRRKERERLEVLTQMRREAAENQLSAIVGQVNTTVQQGVPNERTLRCT